MQVIRTLVKKELIYYCTSVVSFINFIFFVYAVAFALFFNSNANANLIMPIDLMFEYMPYILLILIPAISMRIWAVERKENTLLFLLSFPIRESELLISKFMAVCVHVLMMITTTIPLFYLVHEEIKLSLEQFMFMYLAVSLLSILMLAIGFFVSALSKRQSIVYIISFIFIFLFYNVSHPLILDLGIKLPYALLQYISIDFHYKNLLLGEYVQMSVFYFLSAILFFLCMTFEVIKQKDMA
eukprot:COSAG01_NODE_398_length_17547_cov_206.793501_6_plen_241_part_00